MKKNIRTLFYMLLFVFSIFLISCSNKTNDKDIVIMYTTDVHCGIDQNLGYSSLASYKKEIEKNNKVFLVDSGDFSQGDFIGAVSKGEYIVDIMNYLNYDLTTIGNHEFDYGIDALQNMISKFNGDVLSCNVSYVGNKEDKLDEVLPYKILKYGNTKIGFVGVTTPETLISSSPVTFKEDGEYAYSFSSDTRYDFYDCIQDNVDACRKQGSKYVFLLGHLGSTEETEPFSSIDVISNTTGIDAVLDGHAHVDLDWTDYNNKDGKPVKLCDTGYKLNEFATITINKKGDIKYDFITDYEGKDEDTTTFLKSITDKCDEITNQVVANIDMSLSIYDENKIRMVRNQETQIGNLVADSYRFVGDSQIGIVNGGGIRYDLTEGDVTYGDVQKVHPFGNRIVVKKVLGIQILDYLEFVSKNKKKETVENGIPLGENGGFANVSGLKYTIDTSIEPSIETDSIGNFIGVTGQRRVKDVMVLDGDTYKPLEEDKYYTLSSHNFLLEDGGDGAIMFVESEELKTDYKLDYEVLIEYISDYLDGKLKDKYSTIEGRITIL